MPRILMKPCEICGLPMEAKSPQKRAHSDCANRARQARHHRKVRKTYLFKCRICGVQFVSARKDRVVCSSKDCKESNRTLLRHAREERRRARLKARQYEAEVSSAVAKPAQEIALPSDIDWNNANYNPFGGVAE